MCADKCSANFIVGFGVCRTAGFSCDGGLSSESTRLIHPVELIRLTINACTICSAVVVCACVWCVCERLVFPARCGKMQIDGAFGIETYLLYT